VLVRGISFTHGISFAKELPGSNMPANCALSGHPVELQPTRTVLRESTALMRWGISILKQFMIGRSCCSFAASSTGAGTNTLADGFQFWEVSWLARPYCSFAASSRGAGTNALADVFSILSSIMIGAGMLLFCGEQYGGRDKCSSGCLFNSEQYHDWRGHTALLQRAVRGQEQML
jgi:hypothetical protein